MKKILWVGEFTELNTGFSVYGKELLSRLHKTGKYEIYELASYCSPGDSRIRNIPWKVIPNHFGSEEEKAKFKENVANQWGAWKFEQTLLDIKPDVVMSVRDPWMEMFIVDSPFRDKFYWIHMPTVDSSPLQEGWLSTYTNADAILTYSEFGRDALIKETGGRINFCGVSSPAVNYEIFKPVKDKKAHKKSMGLQENIIIVGTVNRNQKRKLYPELLNAFADFIKIYPTIGKNTYLYCHTQYPDLGWDFPRLIKESGLSAKVLFSYICTNCNYTFPAFFRDALSYCPRCKQLTCKMPGPSCGYTSEQLANIYNCFDVYVQYSITEGCGMGQIEAAGCAVPIMSVNYSAMESVVKNLNGTPINVATLFRECETHAYRAYPDNADFVKKLYNFLSKPENVRLQKGYETYLLCRKFYDYDQVAALWASVIDKTPSYIERWAKPKRPVSFAGQIPDNLSNEQFVRWCAVNILQHIPVNDYYLLQLIRDLNYGTSTNKRGAIFHSEDSVLGAPQMEPYTREKVLNELRGIVNKYNYWENKR